MMTSNRALECLLLLALAAATACGDDTSQPPGGGGGNTASGGGSSPSGGSPSGSSNASTGAGPTGSASTSSASTGGSGGGPVQGGGCAGADIFCSDFEADALPAELTFFPAYLRDRAASFVSVDTTGHSGTRSVKVNGTDFSQMLGVDVPATFWGRVYMKSDTDIQQGHNTYIAATTGDGDPNAGEHIRIGEHQCQLELNRKSDDAERLSNGGMYTCSGGVKLLANTWYCLEFFYDGPGREVRVFVDGAEVDALHVTDWGPYDYRLFKLGFEKYHGAAKTLWYDDLALGRARVSCAP
jgi:hypothetical protein